jgi:hypothetical protein
MKIMITREELECKLAQAAKDDLIELCIVPAQTDGSEYYPKFLHIASIHNGQYYDLEAIDAVEKNANIKTA